MRRMIKACFLVHGSEFMVLKKLLVAGSSRVTVYSNFQVDFCSRNQQLATRNQQLATNILDEYLLNLVKAFRSFNILP
jgi:hypothetical protein